MSTVVRVGSRAASWRGDGLYLDGDSADPRPVRVGIDETDRTLVFSAGEAWPLDDIREVPDQAGQDLFVLRLRNDPVKRLILREREVAPRLRYAQRRAPVARRGRLVAWALAAVASVALILFVLVPRMADQLAAFIPPEGARALGEVTLTEIRRAFGNDVMERVPLCSDAEGLAALGEIESRLAGAAPLEGPLSLLVLDHGLVNAFALPGGYVVLFAGLIDAAETPEQLASVIAHEIGHVVSRDPTRHALRSAGSIGVLGLLLGDFAGGAAVLLLAERLIDAQYSQTAEAAADVFAQDLLLRAELSPAALGEIFDVFRAGDDEASGLVQHFLSHPGLGDRIAAARAAVPDGFEARALLEPEAWAALKGVCAATRDH